MEDKSENIQKNVVKNTAKKNRYEKIINTLFIFFIIFIIFLILLPFVSTANKGKSTGVKEFKPVIYLYPTVTTDINVKLEYNGELFADYPSYDDSIQGWSVVAEPDGKLLNLADNREYSYIFWEGIPEKKIERDLSKGFVVKGEDTIDFLQEKLPELGLTPIEYNEFIVFWYPLMKDNTYNFIHFAGDQYTDGAPLEITPSPDSMLRVFMVYKPLKEYIEVEEQIIEPFERKGFSVIEWGGSIID